MNLTIQNALKNSSNIIRACKNSQENVSAQNPIKDETTKKNNSAIIKNINEESIKQVQVYLQKLKHKKKKHQNHNFIRKSDLGENQLTFNKVEEMKLEMIDQFLEKGLQIPNLFDMEQKGHKFEEQKTVKQTIGIKQAQNKQINEQASRLAVLKELHNFYEWESEGNKQKVIDQKLKDYLDTVQFPLERKKRIKKKQLKVINFHTVSQRKSAKQNIRVSKNSIAPSLKSNKSEKSVNLKLLAPKILLAQFEPKKYIDYAERKKFPPIKEIVSKDISIQQIQALKRKQKIQQISQNVLKKYFCKKPDSSYMTDQRYQALYECEVIKGAKEIMDYKQYVNLGLLWDPSVDESEKSMQDQEIKKVIQKKSYDISSKETFREIQEGLFLQKKANKREQIQKIIEKNQKRLKVERQRIIQKIRC